jgi:hypothetical protein
MKKKERKGIKKRRKRVMECGRKEGKKKGRKERKGGCRYNTLKVSLTNPMIFSSSVPLVISR